MQHVQEVRQDVPSLVFTEIALSLQFSKSNSCGFSLLALSPEDVLPAVYLCTNKIAPDHENTVNLYVTSIIPFYRLKFD